MLIHLRNSFSASIGDEKEAQNITISPEAARVVEIFDGEIFDLGNSTFDDFYSQAVDTFEQVDTFT